MRVAIIGGTGFVGGYLIEALLAAGHEPAVLVRPGSEAKLAAASRCRVTRGELGSEKALATVLEGAAAVIYNVGILREQVRAGITFERLQFDAAATTARVADAAGVGRFLLMSANGVKPGGVPYQDTKFRAEEFIAGMGFAFTAFRPSVIFGDPRGKLEIATQLWRDLVRPPLPAAGFQAGLWPGSGPALMSPVHVRDVADAFVAALDDPATHGRRIELGGPEVLSWTEMLRRVAAATGRRKLVVPVPIGLMRIAATLLDRLPAFPVTRDQLTMLAEGNVATPEALRALIGRSPKGFTVENLAYLA